MDKQLDILAFGAHPDDVELGCGGTIAKQVNLGSKIGIVDLTKGELGTRGTAEIRDKVEKELEPDTIVKMQNASRKRYKEFTTKEATEDKKEIKKTEKNYES